MDSKKKISLIFKDKKTEPFFIAEIGANHNGSIELAKKQILLAKKSGADCVKFQNFSISNLFSEKFYPKGSNIHKQIKKYSLNYDNFVELYVFSRKNNILFSSTPFSEDDVDFLVKKIDVPFIKVASMDLNNTFLIEYISKSKKPIILSTGLSSYKEISNSVEILKKKNCNFAFLHCISEYPPKNKDLNLNRINKLKNLFKVPVGFSDHSIGIIPSLTAVSVGACIIEKHFTSNKNLSGWDHNISADYKDLKELIYISKKIYISLGNSEIKPIESIKKIKSFRRSVVAKFPLKKGTVLTKNNIAFKRPGNGISPDKIKSFFGYKLNKKLSFDELILRRHLIK